MPALRVLQVLEATEGGTRTHLRDLVLGLDPARFAVDVAVGLHRDPDFDLDLERFTARGVGVHLVDMHREVAVLPDWRAYRRLQSLIRHGRYDIVHGHSSKGGFLARAAARGSGAKVVYTANAFRFQSPECRGMARRMVVGLERLAARWCDVIIAVSEGEREEAIAAGLPAGKIEVIPNGIDVAALESQTAEGGRDVLGVPEGVPLVLTIGRRAEQKGDIHLLTAWPAVQRRFPEAQLALVGDGPLWLMLQAMIAELGLGGTVHLVPRQSEVGRLYRAADVYVLPSLYEGLPYTLLEAMALSRPCVATMVAGSRDVVVSGQTGILVPPADPEALARALIGLLSDPAGATALGLAARSVVLEEYTAERMVAATAGVYERVGEGR